MNALLVALLLVLLLPLFAASWRTSLLGLAGQGLLMAWIAIRLRPEHATPTPSSALASGIARLPADLVERAKGIAQS